MHLYALKYLACAVALAGALPVVADQGAPAKASQAAYSPNVGRDYPIRPLFGDTHLHTSMSMDAGVFGARLGPQEAYRFARGEQVTASSGQPVKLARPLDFLVVADHSDGYGLFPLLVSGAPSVMADEQGRKLHEMIRNGQGAQAAIELITSFGNGTLSKQLVPVPGSETFRNAW